jgi:hypothetical protein
MRPTPLPGLPVILVIVVLALVTALTVSGMATEQVLLTVAAGGLLGVELVRRLFQSLPRRQAL